MIRQNLRTYFKFLSKNKLYTFVSVFGFSVSLMFVILLGVYTKQELSVDKFHEKKDRIYLMTHDYEAFFGNTVAPFVQEKCPEVEAFCRVQSRDVVVGDKDSEKISSEVLFADSTFFTMFSFNLIEGNPSQVLEAKQSVVVTQAFANKVFPGETPLGKTLKIDGMEHTVTGIMEEIPQNTHLPQAEAVVTYSSIVNYWGNWILETSSNFGFTMYFLEKEGADLPSKTPMLLEEFKKEFWYYKNGFTDKLEFVPLEEVYFTVKNFGQLTAKLNSRSQVSVYLTIAFLILIIATLNYVNMTMAQSGFRGKEAAIKKLVGSDRKSIISQLLGESLVMTVLTFGIGLLLAFAAEPFFNDVLTTRIELAKQLTLPIILVMTAAIIVISLIAGLVPALVISGFKPIEVVKGSFAKKVKMTYSKGLIIFQYIIAATLLICSFFIKQQSDYLINYEMGYNQERIFSMYVGLDTVQTHGFKDKLLAMPEIECVSYSSGTPMDRGNNYSFEKDGEQYSTQEIIVDDEFFNLYGITYEPAGEPFTEKSLLINKALLNTPLADKINKTIDLGYNERFPFTGLLSDFHLGSLNDDRKLLRIKKLSSGMRPWSISVKVSEGADLFSTAEKVEKEYIAYTGGERPSEPVFVTDIVKQWYVKEQKLSKIISAFTLLTILISVMGVFAMSLYMIRQKEKEIGIRKVNGATVKQVLFMLNKETQFRVLIGFIIASPIAYYAINRWLQDFSYRISLNWWTFALTGVIIALLTLVSVSYLTWKAARANPVKTLKSE